MSSALRFWDEHELLGYVVVAIPSIVLLGLLAVIWRAVRKSGRSSRLVLARLSPPVVFGFAMGLPAAILLNLHLREEYPHVTFWSLVLAVPATFLTFGLAFGLDSLLIPSACRLPFLSRKLVILLTLATFVSALAIYGSGLVTPPL